MGRLIILALVATAAAGCGRRDDSGQEQVPSSSAASRPAHVMTIGGLAAPESVIHDTGQDVYFVTNINGNPGAKDGNGFISRMKPDGAVDSLHFVMGGRGGATLNAPKGTAITGDTLWVADLDAVRGFDRRTGAPLATIEFGRRARFLNDMAVGADGRLYVSETGVSIDDQGAMAPTGLDNVFRIGGGHRVESIMVKAKAPNPNGIITYNGGLLIGSASSPEIFWWMDGVDSLRHVGSATGTVDGIAVLDDGRILASSWDDSTISVVGATPVSLITGVGSPADFGLDRKRHRLLIPQLAGNQVQVWQLP